MTRLRNKKIQASWTPVEIDSETFLQSLTNAMSYNSSVQINYRGSGWRSVIPYGWHSSQDGNILLMCYKDTGEIRSYRVDRIYDLLVDDRLLDQLDNMTFTFDDFQMPRLPNLDQIIEETEREIDEEMPFDDAMDALFTSEIPEEYSQYETEVLPENEISDNLPTEQIDDNVDLSQTNDTNISDNSSENDSSEENLSEENLPEESSSEDNSHEDDLHEENLPPENDNSDNSSTDETNNSENVDNSNNPNNSNNA